MTPRRQIALLSLTACVLLSAPRAAQALVEPARAQADVDAATREKAFTFCSKPRRPLSNRALALCDSATDIPSCEGFAAACADARTPEPHVTSLSPAALAVIAWLVRAGAWLFVLTLVVALLVPIVRALARSRRTRKLAEPDTMPRPATERVDVDVDIVTTTDEDVLLERAAAHARRAEYAIALQLYLAASLRALDKRGAVRIARDRTNGEYVRSCSDPDARAGLREIVREVDRVQFGREVATPEAVDRALRRATAIVRGLKVALLVLTAALLGCGGAARGRHPGDDPAGDELLLELLHRQNVQAQPLQGSLSSLPLPSESERARSAVLVDAERTEMDDETRTHLVEWVDAGGSLVLAGAPYAWPHELGVVQAMAAGPTKLNARRLLAKTGARAPNEDDDDEYEPPPEGQPVYALAIERGELTMRTTVNLPASSERVAWFDDDAIYAVVVPHGKGQVLAIASDELLTNAGLARPGNAAAALAILSNMGRVELKIAEAEDGVSPPSTPLSAMNRAGLGLGMVHALLAALVLFLAAGTRLARAMPAAPPLRRAFVEHVEAMGALYARTGNGEHALAAYTRFVEERLRARMPRGTTDIAAFLASRARLPLDVCERVWKRATAPNAPNTASPGADALIVLKELAAVYAAATAQDL